MLKRFFYIFSSLLIMFYFSTSCTPTTRTTQSQQTWNEYKGKGKKNVNKKKDYRDRKHNK
jgi:hypothetical protein